MWWFVASVGLAQQEVCTSHPVALWVDDLEQAEQWVVELKVDRARTVLDGLHLSARCLADAAPPDALAQYAQLRALLALYDQDPEPLEAWVAVAMDIAPLRRWPVALDHPIHRHVREGGPVPESERVFAPPKRGAVFVDGRFAERPTARPGVPHLLQVFDADGRWVDGAWIDGAQAPERWVGDGEPPGPPKTWPTSDTGSLDDRPRWRLARRDQIPAYERYVRRNPDGEHAAFARRRIDDLRWGQTPRTEEGALAYLADFPEGRNRGGAQAVLDGVAFELAQGEGTAEALQAFVEARPDSVFVQAARRLLDQRAWREALQEGTEAAYARYRAQWPHGLHVEEARVAQDELAWLKAVAGGRRAIEAYLRAWPRGNHALQARATLDGLTFRRISVAVVGEASDDERAALSAAIAAALASLGFQVNAEPAEAALRFSVGTLDVGAGLSRRLGNLIVTLTGHDDPLLRVEVLAELDGSPEAMQAFERDAVDAVSALARWRRRR